MSDLVAFLRARIDEDERRAQGANPNNASVRDAVFRSLSCYSGDVLFVTAMSPARLLAEVQAKRAIIAHAEFVSNHGPAADYERAVDLTTGAAAALQDVLRWLVLPYSEHPDCHPSWLPPVSPA